VSPFAAANIATADVALRVGQAAGVAFRRGEHRHRMVIGKDTRLSSYMIEYALVAGFASVGVDVLWSLSARWRASGRR
jgi:phosphoglucosamine mutase